MTVLWVILGYLGVGFVVAVLTFRYIFDDYDREHFPPALLWLGWWLIAPAFCGVHLRRFFHWCARKLP